MKTEVNPPTQIDLRAYEKFVFLAGSIEMDKAEKWQERVIDLIEDNGNWEICIFNPHRKDWNSSWEQKIENKHFKEQVNWELNSIEHSDTILFYYPP